MEDQDDDSRIEDSTNESHVQRCLRIPLKYLANSTDKTKKSMYKITPIGSTTETPQRTTDEGDGWVTAKQHGDPPKRGSNNAELNWHHRSPDASRWSVSIPSPLNGCIASADHLKKRRMWSWHGGKRRPVIRSNERKPHFPVLQGKRLGAREVEKPQKPICRVVALSDLADLADLGDAQ